MLTSWLHLLALTVYLGAVIGLWVMLIPCVRRVAPQETQLKLLAQGLKLYNPLQVGALGIVVLTGAFAITDLKANYRGLFAQQLGGTLAIKLALSFFLIILSTYQAMGIAHRFVRRFEADESLPLRDIEAITHRLRALSIAILLLAAPIVWLGIRL
ncbi:MAG: hypothetical protein HYT78_19905 [Deltaproteobacteria bacterium]|nr:hypothetical protein [Deltaproteobacteria bacterium]